jgi:predicted PurR-regulated permease PerM
MASEYAKKTTSAIILGVLFILSFILLRPILYAMLGGLFLAFILTPLYKKTLKYIPNKNLSASLICTLVIIIILLIMWLITPILIKQSIEIYQASQKIDVVTPLKNIFPSVFSSETIAEEIGSVIYSFITKITNSTMNFFANLILNFPTLLLQMLVVLFTFFFILRDGDKVVPYLQSLLPFSKDIEEKLFKSTKDITFSVVYGQVVLGILQGIVVGIGYLIFGVNNALFLMILSCLAGIFPIIGTSIVWVPVSIYLLATGNIVATVGVLVFGLVSAIIENAIKPIFVSKKTNVHSGIILLGMIGGLFVFGILGVILGPLILSYLLILLELYRDKRTPGMFIKEEK